MSQSRRMSLVETLANTGSGVLISWLAGLVVYPLFGFAVGGGQAPPSLSLSPSSRSPAATTGAGRSSAS